MHRRILFLSFIIFFSICFINWGCTKIDTTSLGADVIPAVDNVNTFADTFYVNAVQKDFDDTTIVVNTDYHALGNINNDPLFGKATANSFFQLKPTTYPYSFGPKDSIIAMDSVVLCLSYKYFWGDSTAPQKVQAFEVNNLIFADSSSKPWYANNPPTTGAAISQPKDIDVRTLKNYMKYAHRDDSVNNQIRIPLDAVYANRLFTSDSAATGPGNHAFFNDSIYRRNFNGIAVKAIGAGSENGLMYINLADTNTKLEIHYRIKNAGKIDTTYKSFVLSTTETTLLNGVTVKISSTANSVQLDRSGSPAGAPPANEIYLQTQPGTYASLNIPFPIGYSNRIVHRAELIIEQVPDVPFYDTSFSAPNFVYLDLKEPGTTIPAKYKPIYHDLNPGVLYDPDYTSGAPFYPTGGADYGYFGGYLRKKTGPLGTTISYYNINITRYVQRMVTKQEPNYEMRLFPAFRFHYPQYDPGYVAYNNNVAYGRIRVGNGTHPVYPMRVRVVYSKIK